MIRWFVKRVVKFILEALAESDDLDRIIEKFMKSIPIGMASSSIEEIRGAYAKEIGKVAELGDDVDSTAALVDYMVNRSKDVEMSDISGSETVTSADKAHDEVMDIMKNIGD
jgi:hypothetical protein